KTTTLACMINYINENFDRHIITVEEPIEYYHTHKKSIINQREVGIDVPSFSESLRRVLRQDPDVILVGEMRDPETADAVLTVAETGHLILTTGHAPSATQAIERVIDLFPPHQRHLAQVRLASLLVGALCQALVPRADGSGRVAAVEIMLGHPAVKSLIREGKVYQLPNVIRTHREIGMISLDETLVGLYLKGTITGEIVLDYCNDRQEVEKLIGKVSV
ncbi:MAG: Flp pilus assembly complex ATPase component TadA, partial [Dehalococcoidia bacterium]|nr:Flp pilus assembly complex ATPase component TadA [Dehalococcoidia bacterium]